MQKVVRMEGMEYPKVLRQKENWNNERHLGGEWHISKAREAAGIMFCRASWDTLNT